MYSFYLKLASELANYMCILSYYIHIVDFENIEQLIFFAKSRFDRAENELSEAERWTTLDYYGDFNEPVMHTRSANLGTGEAGDGAPRGGPRRAHAQPGDGTTFARSKHPN